MKKSLVKTTLSERSLLSLNFFVSDTLFVLFNKLALDGRIAYFTFHLREVYPYIYGGTIKNRLEKKR